VVVLVTLLMLVVAGFTLGRASSQAAGPSAHRPLPTITVAPGETLWQIAARVDPGADRRALVDQIESLNDLHDGRVIAGQQLRLPRR
jgi:Tfp pilus assembly protein FimV